MVFDKIELKDPEYGSVKKSSKIRKIKFKSLSFKNISNLWKNFRISNLNKRLESAKDKLVSMEIKNQDFNEKTLKGDMTVAEKKILKKTTAIARLESKIEFLRTGTEATDDFISSRAIKLKNNMMSNMRYNCNSAYSVLPEDAEKIFEDEPIEKVISDTQKKIAKTVQEMMAEKKKTEEPTTEVVTEPEISITAPSQEAMKSVVDEMFKTQEKVTEPTTEVVTEPVEEETVSKEDVTTVVQDEYAGIDVTPTVTEKDTEEAVNESLKDVKISKNESSAAKVNKFINEDGTYRMKREDIDEDFRVTRFDRNENPRPRQRIDVSKFVRDENNNPRTMVEMMKKALEDAGIPVTDIREVPEDVSTKEEPTESSVERVMPEITPTRQPQSVKQQVQDLSAAVDEAETMDDIKAIMESVAQLEKQQEQNKSKAAAVAEDSEELRAEKEKAVQELRSYREALQADVAESSKQVEAQQAANAAMADEIRAIRGAMKGRR